MPNILRLGAAEASLASSFAGASIFGALGSTAFGVDTTSLIRITSSISVSTTGAGVLSALGTTSSLLNLPMAILFASSRIVLSDWKSFIKIPYWSSVNLVAGLLSIVTPAFARCSTIVPILTLNSLAAFNKLIFLSSDIYYSLCNLMR